MARAVIGALRVVLGLDSAEFTNGISRASKATAGFAKSASVVQQAASTLTTTLRGLGAAFGVATVGAAGKAFINLAEQSKQMSAQLKLATAEFGRFGQAQQDVRRIAAQTYSGLSETTKLYGTFNRAVKDIGGSQDDAARATETFTKALKLGGASTEETASATLQFSQALASGTLRGDELNSIMEASPRLARLLADSLGVTVGQLRALGAEGELSSDKLLKALTDKKFTAGIDAEFKQLPVTFQQAMSQVTNAAVITFGAFDSGGQFSTALANFVSDGADGFADLETRATNFGIEVRSVVEGLQTAWMPFFEAGRTVLDTLGLYTKNLFKGLKDQVAEALGVIDDVANLIPKIAGKSSPLSGLWNVNLKGSFLDSYTKSATKLTLDSIMRGDPLRDAPTVSSVSKGVVRPSSTKAKSTKAKTPTDYAAEAMFEWAKTGGIASGLGDNGLGVSDHEQFFTEWTFDDAVKRANESLDGLLTGFKKTSKEGSEAMVNLANNSLNALSNLAQSIKSGGFLDILSSAFNAFGALSKTGILGKGLAGTFKDFTGISGFRAFGGPVTGGRSYVVGERGPELFTPTRSGYVHPNGANDNGGYQRFQIVPSAYFDVVVDQRAAGVAAPMAARAGVAASADAQTSIMRRRSRTIP